MERDAKQFADWGVDYVKVTKFIRFGEVEESLKKLVGFSIVREAESEKPASRQNHKTTSALPRSGASRHASARSWSCSHARPSCRTTATREGGDGRCRSTHRNSSAARSARSLPSRALWNTPARRAQHATQVRHLQPRPSRWTRCSPNRMLERVTTTTTAHDRWRWPKRRRASPQTQALARRLLELRAAD